MVNINLLPKEIIEHEKLQSLIKLSIFIFISISFFLIVLYIIRVSKFNNLNLKYSKIEFELKKFDTVINEIKQLESTKATLEARKNLVKSLITNGLSYPKFMVHLVRLLPEGVWLENMTSFTNFDNERKIKEIKVKITCKCYDKFLIADFLSNLESSDNYRNIVLGPIDIEQDKYELHKFTLEFTYIPK